jgi:acyl carrier protein
MTDENKIKQIISEHLGVPLKELKNQSDLRQDLNAQDLEITDLLMKLEKEFSQTISQEDARRLKTVNDIIDLFQPE